MVGKDYCTSPTAARDLTTLSTWRLASESFGVIYRMKWDWQRTRSVGHVWWLEASVIDRGSYVGRVLDWGYVFDDDVLNRREIANKSAHIVFCAFQISGYIYSLRRKAHSSQHQIQDIIKTLKYFRLVPNVFEARGVSTKSDSSGSDFQKGGYTRDVVSNLEFFLSIRRAGDRYSLISKALGLLDRIGSKMCWKVCSIWSANLSPSRYTWLISEYHLP